MTILEICAIIIAASLVIGLVLPTFVNLIIMIRSHLRMKALLKKPGGLETLISSIDSLGTRSGYDEPINKEPL